MCQIFFLKPLVYTIMPGLNVIAISKKKREREREEGGGVAPNNQNNLYQALFNSYASVD